MENPNTWTEIQKKINNSLYGDFDAENDNWSISAKKVFEMLSKEELLKETLYDVELIIEQVIDQDKADFDAGMCGYSLPTQIYNRLVGLNIINQ